jgi:hypothetical protein
MAQGNLVIFTYGLGCYLAWPFLILLHWLAENLLAIHYLLKT